MHDVLRAWMFGIALVGALAMSGAACSEGGGEEEVTPVGTASEWDAVPVADYPYPIEMLPNEAPTSENRHFQEGEFEGFNTHKYLTDPPTSGKHVGELAQAGAYDAPPVPNEVALHNMEHGYVIVWYNCNADPMLLSDDCAAIGNELKSVVQPLIATGRNIVLTPHLTMEPRIALTAWQFLDVMDEPDEERIATFIETFECHYDPEGTCG
jgi:hypothetical protein